MTTIPASQAQTTLNQLIAKTADSHTPVVISGEHHNAVLLSETDWNAIQETLHLLSVPGMRESIRKGMETPVSECDKDPGW